MIAAVVTGLVVLGNCGADDTAQGFALVGLPVLIGLACGWTGWHLSTKPRSGRAATAVVAGVATGMGGMLLLAFHFIASCST